MERSRHAHEKPGFLSVHTVDRWLATIDAEVLKRQQAERERDSRIALGNYEAACRNQARLDREVQRLRAALSEIAESTPGHYCKRDRIAAAALDREGEGT